MAITSIKTGSSFTNLQKYNDFLGPNAAYDPAATFFIQRVTATGGETSLSFTSIPQTYSSLQLRGISRDTAANSSVQSVILQLNNDTGSNYAWHRIEGSGSAASAGGATSQTYSLLSDVSIGNSSTSGIFGTSITDIHNYTSTTQNKTIRGYGGADANGSGYISLFSSLWLNTAAITSITLKPGNTAFAAGTTFALYGMKG